MTLVVTHPYVSTITETTPSGGAGGTVGPTEWNANHTLTGVASPAQGGTGITSGTGVTFFSSATVLADSGTLPLNQVLLGGGANASPTFVSTLGSTLQVLYGGSPPQWGTAATTTGSTGGGGSVGGSSGSVQFSTGGTFGGDTNFTYTPGGQVAINLSSSTSTAGISGLSIATSSSSNMASNSSALKITGAFNNSGTIYDAPLFMNITNTASSFKSLLMDLQLGGTSQFIVDKNGNAVLNGMTAPAAGNGIIVLGNTQGNTNCQFQMGGDANTGFSQNNLGRWGWFANGATIIELNTSGVNLANNGSFGWASSSVAGNSFDTALFRDAAVGVLALGDKASNTTATGLRVYNTTDNVGTNTAPTNYERGVFDWTTTANVLTIGTQASGTGTARAMLLVGVSASATSTGVATFASTNCPAVTPTAVYQWVKVNLSDGSTAFIPAWK